MSSCKCLICQELFGKMDVAAVNCGHTYHTGCLNSWLNEKKECPVCRVKVRNQDVIPKLFFATVENNDGTESQVSSAVDEENASLKKQIESVENELCAIKIANGEEKLFLEQQAQTVRNQLKDSKSAISVLKKENSEYRAFMAVNEELSVKNRKLKEELRKYKGIDALINGVREKDADAFATGEESFEVVKTSLAIMKKKYNDMVSDKVVLNNRMKELERELKAKKEEAYKPMDESDDGDVVAVPLEPHQIPPELCQANDSQELTHIFGAPLARTTSLAARMGPGNTKWSRVRKATEIIDSDDDMTIAPIFGKKRRVAEATASKSTKKWDGFGGHASIVFKNKVFAPKAKKDAFMSNTESSSVRATTNGPIKVVDVELDTSVIVINDDF